MLDSQNGQPEPSLPTARLQQMRSGPEDDRLTQRAQLRRPGVKHWWGRRSYRAGAFALCYLCDETITTWSGRWPITVSAQLLIDVHRGRHLDEGPGPLDIQEAFER